MAAAAASEDGPSFSAFLGDFLNRLSSPSFTELISISLFYSKPFQRLETTLHEIQTMLNDTEHIQLENPALKKWLDYLKYAVHLADDLLSQIASEDEPETKDKVRQWEHIIIRIESIFEHADFFGLKEISGENLSCRTPPAASVERFILGRDKDKKNLLHLLLQDNSDDKISVIEIVGKPGVGKTTLAQLVYNDYNFMQKFDLKAWVYVSEYFDALEVTKTITEELTSSPCNMEDLKLLQLHLREKISGKKFLLVMDNLSDVRHENWDRFLDSFQYVGKGTKILVTTRFDHASGIILPNHEIYDLSPLSEGNSWSLFTYRALFPSRPLHIFDRIDLKDKFIERCDGLPLAIQMLGYLQKGHGYSHLKSILKHELWGSSRKDFLPVCYYYLPAPLKRCFASSSSYPRGYRFNKGELVSFWVTRGLLQLSNSEKTSEEVGNEYFDELVSRSFLQHFSIDSSSRSFVMHDLIHDFAKRKAVELKTFLPLNLDLTGDVITTIPSISMIQIIRFFSLTLPTMFSPLLRRLWMIPIRFLNWRIPVEDKLWRLMGLVSSGVGLLCHALSPSFTRLIRGWNTFKIVLYVIAALVIFMIFMFLKKSLLERSGKIKVLVGFVVLMLTSVYSFFYDNALNGKPDHLSMISNGAFALMSLSLSRVLHHGFEVGLFAFFLGSFAIQLMTFKPVLVLVAIIYGFPLYFIHSKSNVEDQLPR